MPLRSLPLRVSPLPGEALDSWLETLAHRHRCAFGDLLRHIGIERKPGQWLILLHEHEVLGLAQCTGIAPEVLQTMTLDRFNGTALDIDAVNRRVVRTYGWKSRQLSRFCPHCLFETGGRWQLAWRLRWSFACTAHRCILADTCESCGHLTRTQVHPHAQIPRPGRCAHRCRDENNNPALECDADLAARKVIPLPEGHPVLKAQDLICAVIRDGVATLGVYSGKPCTGRVALAEIKCLAAQILSMSGAASFARTLPPSLHDLYLRAKQGTVRLDPYTGVGVAADSPLATAVATTLAIAGLQGCDMSAIGTL